jgi:hypothetical protein
LCEVVEFQLTGVKNGKRIEAEGEIYGFQNTLKNVTSYRYYPSGGAEENMQPWEPKDSTKPL